MAKLDKIRHSWHLSAEEALNLQRELASLVIRCNHFRSIKTIAGIDAHYWADKVRAGVAVFSLPSLDLIECATAVSKVTFPYIPGLFSFREAPSILKALSRLNSLPDLMLVDGQGVAHPRRFGIASHIGLLAGIPSIGCAKTRLIGSFKEPPRHRGAYCLLRDKDEVVGAVLRTKNEVKPVFVSIGHMVDLSTAILYSLKSCRGRRIPEPLRHAHHLAEFGEPVFKS